MHGPDFVLAPITEWLVPPGGAPARLVLGDGSVWMMAPNDPAFAGVRAMVELQRSRNAPIFASGDRRTGRLERVAMPRLMRPQSVAQTAVGDQLQVTFAAAPSFYYLRTDRPWFGAARDLLLRAIALQTPTTFPPELLVTIDIPTLEVMDVRQL
jgi:hypothetical protein